MTITAISDTHGQHAALQLPPADVLIHSGDISNRGENTEIRSFLNWLQQQDFAHKIFIAGNHDFFFEKTSDKEIAQLIPPGIIYLNDSGTTINGIKIWGSPVTPWFMKWAFNRHRGNDIRRHWDMVPADTDILITHGPAYAILDKNAEGQHIGCEDLLARVKEVNPKLHLFGHIHESYGNTDKGQTRFINASVLNERYKMTNKPVQLEV